MTTEPARWRPLDERIAYGKALRQRVPRAEQAQWKLGVRDVLGRIKQAERGRQPELLAVKYAKMATSPFAFLRGGAAVMAPDLAAQPVTGYSVQICGDAHVRNLGAYATEDHRLAFDINDFDETCRGPWEWDVKKLAISIVLVGREAGCGESVCRDAVRAMVCMWRETVQELVKLSTVAVSQYRVKRVAESGVTGRALQKAERMTPLEARERWTVQDDNGRARFVEERIDGATARAIIAGFAEYRATIGPARQQVFDAYQPYDVARRIAGTGSLGLHNYMVLFAGSSDDDPLFLQVKEAVASCYQTLGLVPADPRVAAHHGMRVAEGQHRMQTQVDPFLGWTTIEGTPYIVRQLADHEASIDCGELGRAGLVAYARVCGETFAKGHARSGDPAIFAGYVGKEDNFDRAIADLAMGAADQVTNDWEIMLAAIDRGDLQVA